VQELQGWIGRAREVADEMSAPAARRMAAMLDQAAPDLSPGAPVPPFWIAILFDDAQPQSRLGADGHPEKGEFLPPVPLPRRMLAGRRMNYASPLRIGQKLTRRSEITAITPKEGRSGKLCFVTVLHTVTGPDGVVATEEQDIAYREASTGASAKAEAPATKPDAAWRVPFNPDPVLLFRYSALCFNGHRIHYDVDYARDAEGYAGLVVNGGLSTTMLLDAAMKQAPGATLRAADIRTMRPVMCNRPATLAGTAPDEQGNRTLWVEDETGAMALRIQARIS
jgi:3-methylfumaryl-CoA hydratase